MNENLRRGGEGIVVVEKKEFNKWSEWGRRRASETGAARPVKETSFVLTRNDGVVYEEGGEERSTVRNPPNNRFEQRNEGRGEGPGCS